MRLLRRRAVQRSFETNAFLQPFVVAQMIKLPHTHTHTQGKGHTRKTHAHTETTRKSTQEAPSRHQTWPELVPKPFPLICRRAPCLLVMRTGRGAGPSFLPAPRGEAACTNLNCVSNDANCLARRRRRKKTRRKRNRGGGRGGGINHTVLSLSNSIHSP